MNVSNQKPAIISPVYNTKVTGPFDPMEAIKQTIAAPLMTPLSPNAPVVIRANNGRNIDQDEIVRSFVDCCGDTMNATMESWCKSLLGKTLVYFDPNTNLMVQETFAIQSAAKANLPAPTPTVVYTPAVDVIPVSKEFLAGQCDYDKFFGTLAFYARPNTLGFYFASEASFDGFKAWLKTQHANVSGLTPAQTNQLFADFDANIGLKGLTESLILRNNDGENNDEYSFARMLVAYLMTYTAQVSSAEFGVLPFMLGELYCPRTVVFVNVEAHSHATAKQVADEWNIINNSLKQKINMISNNKLNRLTATARQLQKIQSAAANAATNAGAQAGRSMNFKFGRKLPDTVDIISMLKKIMGKMAVVAKSENSYKSVKMSFARPNRRDPDDFNKQGKVVSTQYRPDIHLYLDTSGSISEENYESAVKACIKIARTLDVNLYFNSFSHCMSQCTKLSLKGKSAKQVYAAFQKVPKVDGGTDYAQIWHYINKSKKRKRELSLLITDFEFTAPNQFIEHPKNLYYLPCSRCDWKSITYYAENFAKSMVHNDPTIRKHILF